MKRKELISYMDDKFQVEVPEFWDEIKDIPIDEKLKSSDFEKKKSVLGVRGKRYMVIAASLIIVIISGFGVYKSLYPKVEKNHHNDLVVSKDESKKERDLTFKEKINKIPDATTMETPQEACLAYASLFYNGTHYKSPYWWNPRTYQCLDDYGKVNLINDLLGEEMVKTTYSLGDNYYNTEGKNSYWQVDGAANLAVGSAIYKVKGYDSKDIVMCLLESNSKVPNIEFFCRDNFKEISLDKYKFNADNYIDNIKEAYQVGAFDNKESISDEIDVSVINNVFKSIKGSSEVKFEDHYKLYEEKDDIKNVIDGMRGVRIITKDNIAIYIEVTNSGNVLIYNTWTAYKLDDAVWREIWGDLPIEDIRNYMDREGYNYINGYYVPKDAPLDSPKLQNLLNP